MKKIINLWLKFNLNIKFVISRFTNIEKLSTKELKDFLHLHGFDEFHRVIMFFGASGAEELKVEKF